MGQLPLVYKIFHGFAKEIFENLVKLVAHRKITFRCAQKDVHTCILAKKYRDWLFRKTNPVEGPVFHLFDGRS